MPLFDDHQLPLSGATPDQIRDFQIAWLNRRVENLEAVVLELLRDRVHFGTVSGYLKRLREPGFGPSSVFLQGAGEMMAWEVRQNSPKENLEWPSADDDRSNSG